MTCLLTKGYTNPCSDTQGGLAYVEFADFGSLYAVPGVDDTTYGTENTDVIKSFGGTPNWFKYELNSTANNFVENIVSNEDAGTTYFESTLTLSLKKLSPADTKELKLMAWGRPHVRVTDNNGNQFIMGLENGAKVSGGSSNTTGGAMADFNGYAGITLVSREKTPANFYDESAL